MASKFQGFLKDRAKVEKLVALAYPWVQAIDGLVGERMSMRVCALVYAGLPII